MDSMLDKRAYLKLAHYPEFVLLGDLAQVG
jgi:hypothetical protein